MSSLLECKGVTKRYENTIALDHVDLTIEPGHIIGLLGPNGSGKTTLIKLINGLLYPNEGTILVKGNGIGVESKKVVSYLPDHMFINGGRKIRQMIAYFADFYEDFDVKRAYDMLAKLSINPEATVRTLSKGNKEKVHLIMAMSRRADLYILDEPIAGVDPAARDYILKTILANYDENASILISTHLIADIENILDEVIFLQNGRIRLHASVDDIRQQEGKSVDMLFREVFRC
ncbi:MAG: ABC transporter ATP-binding protein [Lachnospiraceae bacterium]|nr:ABC transporter ATP-binding protein [Lachnospiraceae bacterium]